MKRKTARKKKNNNNYTFKGGFFGRKISPEDEVPKRKLYDILKDAERKYREKVKSQEKDAKVKGLAKKNGPQNISATKSPEFEIESKVYPLPFVNSKGFRIGNYKVFVNTDLLPFTGLDQANHFLYNLFDYVNYEGTPVEKNKKKDISKFFNSTNHKFKAFTPIKYPDESRSTFLEQQQMENEKDYKHLRERARLFMNELAEMGKAGDPDKRAVIKKKIEEELNPIDDLSGITNDEKERRKQVILREYLNAIDELENGLRGDFKPLFNEAFSKDNEGKSFIEGFTGTKGGGQGSQLLTLLAKPTTHFLQKVTSSPNVGFMEHSGVNPRSQVDFTEQSSVTSTCDEFGKKKKRKNNLRSSQKKKGKRKNKTLRNRKK